MPLINGSIYLFGQILSWGMPIGLLLCFAAFFYLQAKKVPKPSMPSNRTRPATPDNRAPGLDGPGSTAGGPPAPGSASADVIHP